MTEMTCYRFFLFSVVIFQMMEVCAEIKLTGTVIGTEESVDYKSGAKTTTIKILVLTYLTEIWRLSLPRMNVVILGLD